MLTIPKFWRNDQRMTKEERFQIYLLRKAGCKCELPLLGSVPDPAVEGELFWVPRCRLCNTEL